jgi:[ribosomal protein S18]-alanine N-acetyltransferase
MLVDANAPDDLLGFCRCVAVPQPGGPTGGEVRTLGVMPHVRRRGFGRHLLRWGVHRLRDAGCGVVTLGVIATNDKALALYVDEGFVSIGEHPSYAMPAS